MSDTANIAGLGKEFETPAGKLEFRPLRVKDTMKIFALGMSMCEAYEKTAFTKERADYIEDLRDSKVDPLDRIGLLRKFRADRVTFRKEKLERVLDQGLSLGERKAAVFGDMIPALGNPENLLDMSIMQLWLSVRQANPDLKRDDVQAWFSEDDGVFDGLEAIQSWITPAGVVKEDGDPEEELDDEEEEKKTGQHAANDDAS